MGTLDDQLLPLDTIFRTNHSSTISGVSPFDVVSSMGGKMCWNSFAQRDRIPPGSSIRQSFSKDPAVKDLLVGEDGDQSDNTGEIELVLEKPLEVSLAQYVEPNTAFLSPLIGQNLVEDPLGPAFVEKYPNIKSHPNERAGAFSKSSRENKHYSKVLDYNAQPFSFSDSQYQSPHLTYSSPNSRDTVLSVDKQTLSPSLFATPCTSELKTEAVLNEHEFSQAGEVLTTNNTPAPRQTESVMKLSALTSKSNKENIEPRIAAATLLQTPGLKTGTPTEKPIASLNRNRRLKRIGLGPPQRSRLSEESDRAVEFEKPLEQSSQCLKEKIEVDCAKELICIDTNQLYPNPKAKEHYSRAEQEQQDLIKKTITSSSSSSMIYAGMDFFNEKGNIAPPACCASNPRQTIETNAASTPPEVIKIPRKSLEPVSSRTFLNSISSPDNYNSNENSVAMVTENPSPENRQNIIDTVVPQMLDTHANSALEPPTNPAQVQTSISEHITTTLPVGKSNKHIIPVNGRPFTRLDIIGHGGSSKVYKVMAPNGRIFALKKVKFDKADQTSVLGYINEINLLKRLAGHERIVKLYDAEVNHDKGYLLMLMECGEIDLAHLLIKQQGKSVNMNFIRMYWEQMLQAVETIHQEKIVHSDLKPANFLLVEGQLKLIDFGIAKAISNDTTNIHRDQQIGTVNYMSPEAIIDTSGSQPGGRRVMRLGRPSDVWSLGCILYQMVYGRTPFSNLTMYQKIQRIPDHQYPIEFPLHAIQAPAPMNGQQHQTLATIGEGVPVEPDLLRVLKSCLQRDIKQRMTIPELLEDPFLKPQIGYAKLDGVMVSAQVMENIVKEVFTFARRRQHNEIVEGSSLINAEIKVIAKTILEQIQRKVPVDSDRWVMMAQLATEL